MIWLIASVGVIIHFIPRTVFNVLPATGGDMGSHFWPVKVLREFGIPNGMIRPWNPGNNGGEGLLVHYFPLPFVLMALFSFIVPTGMAFNIGTILPVVTLPLSVWIAVRLMTMRDSIAGLSAIFASAVVLNEGYSMWGGNTLSTLAGQFAHMYALNFLLLGFGCLWREINRKELPWKSALLFSAVALSHGYLYFGVPSLLLLVMGLHPRGSFKFRFITCCGSAIFSLGVSMWFVGPMILNGPWVTPHSFSWTFSNWIEEVLPRIFEPIIFGAIFGVLAIAHRGLNRRDSVTVRLAIFWWLSGIIYLSFFFVFRWLRLVDVRAIPQTQLFWAIGSGHLVYLAMRPLPQRLRVSAATVLVLFMVFWEAIQVVKFPIWTEWNYSGWQTKPKYKQLMMLSEQLKGDLSQPRVAYEHHIQNNQVGTERVFEMLPYFANRATTESLYLQSTVLAPMIFSLTSEISEGSSCPFHQWPCMRFGLVESQSRQELLGVKQLILSSEKSLKAASEAPFLEKKFTFGPWTVFENKNPVPMVEMFTVAPENVSFEGWRNRFWLWFTTYQKGKQFLVTSRETGAIPPETVWVSPKECHPSTTVDFSGILLKTDCPGVAHYIKYAYHPSFTSSGGEILFLVSPGYLGIVPRSSEVKLSFGSSLDWLAFRWISILFALSLSFLIWKKKGLFRQMFNKSNQAAPQKNKPEIKAKTKSKQKGNKKRTELKLKSDRIVFYLLSVTLVICYGLISYQTESILFWNWRKLNFKDFELVSYHQGYGDLHKNEDLDGRPIVLKGTIYHSGLTTHADSEIKIRIKSDKMRLAGVCGYPDYMNGAEIVCEIKDGAQTLFRSHPLNSATREARFRVPIRKDQELVLEVRTLRPDINAAHAVWVDLRAEN